VTGLAAELRQRIERDGPIGVDVFMGEALAHPVHGYYMRREPFGRAGDFVTAPETSQMFGELVGLWCLDTWQKMGSPAALDLIELGPGRGSLMVDALRAMATLPGARAAFDVHLVETSQRLRAIQRETLRGEAIAWHERVGAVAGGRPAIVIANEFFDALPVRQFVATAKGWRERLIAVDDSGFRPVLADLRAQENALPQLAPPGRVAELSPARVAVMTELAGRIAADGGAALIVDFAGAGDTLQAVRGHRRAERFADPGAADLAAAVDFASLAGTAAAAGAVSLGPVGQGLFLRRLGIEARCRALLAEARPDQTAAIRTGFERLVGEGAMGTLYRVLAVCHRDLAVPAGFAAAP
jgi:NADH dehydrogenase [ubiquinone] 1 alpha subcomplex assembly factor 7